MSLPLDEPVLRAQLRRMIDSCVTMRTAFHLEASPVPMQLVHASVEPSLTVLDAVGNAETANEWFERERGSGFDWDRPGLIRSAAHRTAAERIVLSLSFHHAIIDGWSLSLLVRDLLLSYAAALNGDAPAEAAGVERLSDAFRDYVTAEVAARASTESRRFWRGPLADHPGTTLPCSRSDGSDARWAETTLAVPEARVAQLREVPHRVGFPLKQVLLAAHLRVLALLTGDSDVVSGVFTHSRPESEDAEALVGMILQFQPPRVRIGTQTWLEITEEVSASVMRTGAHRVCATSAAAAGELSLRRAVHVHRISRLRGGFHRKRTERLRARLSEMEHHESLPQPLADRSAARRLLSSGGDHGVGQMARALRPGRDDARR
ncbi:condensation domain-containing protein [Salinispora oceanensis]|uniref:condensation domain-containing protein n=1 Tax=Salinispora oceanensis TaxID=1050199 RepID=UPI00036EBEF7|nr:condensation domain-containing protein [Salinispora oceanensis]